MMKHSTFIMIGLLVIAGVLGLEGIYGLVSNGNEASGFSGLLTKSAVHSQQCADNATSCTNPASIPVVIWLFCCCVIGLAGYKRRKVKPDHS